MAEKHVNEHMKAFIAFQMSTTRTEIQKDLFDVCFVGLWQQFNSGLGKTLKSYNCSPFMCTHTHTVLQINFVRNTLPKKASISKYVVERPKIPRCENERQTLKQHFTSCIKMFHLSQRLYHFSMSHLGKQDVAVVTTLDAGYPHFTAQPSDTDADFRHAGKIHVMATGFKKKKKGGGRWVKKVSRSHLFLPPRKE